MDKKEDVLTDELKTAIQHMVANISKSFIVDWYTSISPTNHDFVASCENLIEASLKKFAELCITRLDKYKSGQLVVSLLHEHILNEKSCEKIASIESQIDNFEYDICQNSVVRLFGLLSNETLRKVVFTTINVAKKTQPNDLTTHSSRYHTAFSKIYGNSIPSDRDRRSSNESNDDIESTSDKEGEVISTTSGLYTLVVAMLTRAAFMPIIENISEPRWLFAVIIWLCKKEERENMRRQESLQRDKQSTKPNHGKSSNIINQIRHFKDDTAEVHHMSPPSSIIVTNTMGDRALDLEEGIDIASANINFVNPICDSLKRPLDNIEIYSTEEFKNNNSCYVLYCIRYDGLCYRHPSAGGFSFIPEQPDVPIIDRRQQTRSTSSTNRRVPNGLNSNQSNEDMSNRRSFRKIMTIKRRFREFVLLQLRLEENPKIRPYLKNIPKPTKLKAATQNIFSLPGIANIKLDQSTIRLRQRFLERFLNALNSSPFIANSYEFKEFFSYNVNPVAGISKSKSTILQVNLNKVFVDSVRSAFSIIRSTLPGDDMHSLNVSGQTDPDAWLTELQQSTLKLHIQTRTSHSKMNLERFIDSKLLSLNDSPVRQKKSASLGKHYRSGAFDWMGSSKGGSLKVNDFKFNSSGSGNTNSPLTQMSRSSSMNSTSPSINSSQQVESNTRSSSIESVYHDASSSLSIPEEKGTQEAQQQNVCQTIQLCESVPIASKLIDIVHYSISGDDKCSLSPINYIARILLGRSIERFSIQLLEAAFTIKNAAYCINSITSSIWDDSDDPPLDLDNASLDEAATRLAKLIESNIACPRLIPKQLLMKLINKQSRFYLSQIASQKRNKFAIYSFFVHLLDELEASTEH